MRPFVRRILSILGQPIISLLAHSDNAKGVLGQDAMITGMTGIAFKLASPDSSH